MRSTFTAAVLAILAASPVVAETHRFEPFIIDDAHPTVLALAGPIEADLDAHFDAAVANYPEIEVLGLHSPGGDVLAALDVALEVAEMGLTTYVPSDGACFSACAYLFLAGEQRHMGGTLGTHMPTTQELESADRVAVDLRMREVLAPLGVPMIVWDSIFNTPHADLRVFGPDEAAELGLNR